MIDPLSTWISTYKALPKVTDNSWAANIANWVYDRVKDAELTGIITASPPFDFKKAVFQSELESLSSVLDPVSGITQFATAWETAINASLTLIVSPGDSVGAPSPPTIWSVITSKLIDASSVTAGKSIIMTLISSPPVTNPELSQFPVKLRLAFLALTGTISGLNSVPPPTGPQPLVASNVSFL